MTKTHFDHYEGQARKLEQIAATLDKGSSAHAALERAGWALAFVTIYHHEQFEQFLADMKKGELSSEQVAFLRKCGLE
jgi:hypothetical protein